MDQKIDNSGFMVAVSPGLLEFMQSPGFNDGMFDYVAKLNRENKSREAAQVHAEMIQREEMSNNAR